VKQKEGFSSGKTASLIAVRGKEERKSPNRAGEKKEREGAGPSW